MPESKNYYHQLIFRSTEIHNKDYNKNFRAYMR